MALYAISLGCFIALMLLVVSMEEGGENLSASSMSLTEAVVLLSQGVGFTAGSVVIGVMPLLLTLLLVALIAQCASKAGVGLLPWLSGLATWVACNLLWAGGTTVELHDPQPAVAAKTATIWTLGYLFAVMMRSPLPKRVITALAGHMPATVRHTLRLTGFVTAVLASALVLTGFVTSVVWIVRGWHGMTTLFTMTGMENGSRILTSIAACVWLPNLMGWAVSWILGAGFHIGDLGVFTMWGGQSAGLPPLPVFGLLPDAVPDERVRIVLQCLIPVTAAVVALVFMAVPGPLRLRIAKPDDSEGTRTVVRIMICHACALCAALILLVAGSCAWYALSDGSLGEHRLKDVGVDVMVSTQTTGRSLAFGFAGAWFVAAVVLAAVYGIHWIVGRQRLSRDASSASTGVAGGTAADDGPSDRPRRPRTIRSDTDLSKSEQPAQEEIDDSNESSD
ncbi:DUF6350 family protein [Bifidobacterium sp. CP2]|uniref:cell division protein PerM n=1 Tax=Bifidobacterium sp. CP2 TaxID=2809025 RepID=UPI001BDCE7EA|nr:DUF6350 family protein [Bifidobacterium sp. CP2]